jgi:hypothetical protein
MCRFLAITLLAGVVFSAVVQPAVAVTRFYANITHDQEVSNPPVPEQGSSGIGFFELNDAQTALSYDIQLFGLDLDGLQTPGNPNDNVTRTHFHLAPIGSNGGIVYGQIDGSAALRNDNNPNDLVVNPVTGRITGIWNGNEGNNTTLAAQLNSLLNGGLYFNVHTSDHAGGEIRGQVLLVPEPSSLLLCCGLAGITWAISRRKR